MGDLVRWMRTRQRVAWPAARPLNGHAPPPAIVKAGQIAVTFIGHSTFLVRTASMTFMTDPVFTSHAGPFGQVGPRRVRPPGLAPSSVPPIDVVVVSHNHYDHLQPESLRLFENRATFVTPLGLAPIVPRARELDWWQTATVNGATITCVPAQHFSARTPWDRNRTLWCGFVVSVDQVTIYFAGDTGYSPHFAEIGARCPPVDIALLPIGAYEPRWFMEPVHMNPAEAVRAHLDVKARMSIGMHFGTFQLTDEGIDDPLSALAAARSGAGVTPDAFRVVDFGETYLASSIASR